MMRAALPVLCLGVVDIGRPCSVLGLTAATFEHEDRLKNARSSNAPWGSPGRRLRAEGARLESDCGEYHQATLK